jgi:Ca2+:H+ antiporter
MFGMTRRQAFVVMAIVATTVLAGVLSTAGAPPVATFVVSALALAGLAWLVSKSTEAVGERFGPAVTGVLQSTLGNLPELFVVFFALQAGEVAVAQTSLLGSLFSNALLVLGLVIVAGTRASKDGVMRFHKRLPQDTSTLLILSLFIIAVLGIAVSSHDPAARHRVAISAIASVGLIAVYVVWLVRYLRDDTVASNEGVEPTGIPLPTAITMLAAAGVGAALVSDWFIAALDPAVKTLHLSKPFAGLVIVAIAGNAVENVAGVALAAKGRHDLAISVVKNSVGQIAAFLFPALILLSLLLHTRLTFVVAPVYIGALALTALALWQITGDGEAYAFEGWALIVLFGVLAVVAFFQ